MSKKYALIGLSLFFFSCSHQLIVVGKDAAYLEVDPSITPDPISENMISPYRIELEKSMDIVLCNSDKPMEKARPESELGNIVADLTLQIGRELYGESDGETIDLCYLNHGGLRASLPKGEITRGHVYSLMPFENELVVVTLSKEGLEQLVAYTHERGGDPMAGITIDLRESPAIILINGRAFDKDRNYKVITTDYLANGGDKMNFFTEGDRVKIEHLEMKMRDAIMLHFERLGKENRTLNGKLDGRIKL